MSVEQLLTGSRWSILQALANEPKSTTELAEELQTSNANISQQLKQLEFAELVTRRRAPEKKGAHYVYEIPDNYTYLARIAPGIAKKRALKKQQLPQQVAATLLLHPHAIELLTFIFCLPDYFKKSIAIGVFERAQPEVFILTEHVEEFRTNSNVELETITGATNVAIWSHSINEVAHGLSHNDQYFYDSLSEVSILYDPDNKLHEFKVQAESNK